MHEVPLPSIVMLLLEISAILAVRAKALNNARAPTQREGIRPNQRALTYPYAHRTDTYSQNNNSFALNDCVAILPASKN